MTDRPKSPKALALEIDPNASCKMEKIPGNWGEWAIVRNGRGAEIGKHRTTRYAWEAAYRTLCHQHQGRL
ncbi:hypothetical protein HYPP_01974 [Hyphomicrobium sp. ghe19]|nr:hypothetical protein HYPP_01974 [Hyphomicrobium sp. ghe19]